MRTTYVGAKFQILIFPKLATKISPIVTPYGRGGATRPHIKWFLHFPSPLRSTEKLLFLQGQLKGHLSIQKVHIHNPPLQGLRVLRNTSTLTFGTLITSEYTKVKSKVKYSQNEIENLTNF